MAEAIGRYPWVSIERRCEWASEPAVGRVVDGLSDRVDPIASLGNSVVPKIPEIIGRAIMSTREYDAQDDMTKSIAEGFRVIRERMAAGGPGWTLPACD